MTGSVRGLGLARFQFDSQNVVFGGGCVCRLDASIPRMPYGFVGEVLC
jgi:hypothetical protein